MENFLLYNNYRFNKCFSSHQYIFLLSISRCRYTKYRLNFLTKPLTDLTFLSFIFLSHFLFLQSYRVESIGLNFFIWQSKIIFHYNFIEKFIEFCYESIIQHRFVPLRWQMIAPLLKCNFCEKNCEMCIVQLMGNLMHIISLCNFSIEFNLKIFLSFLKKK